MSEKNLSRNPGEVYTAIFSGFPEEIISGKIKVTTASKRLGDKKSNSRISYGER